MTQPKKSWIKQMFMDMDNSMLDSIIKQWHDRAMTTSMYPESFLRVAQRMMKQPDRIYKLKVILDFIHADPGIRMGLKPLEGPRYLEHFLPMLDARASCFMRGVKYNGQPFRPGDNLAERHIGTYVMYIAQIAGTL
jgi:hypothetical protein